MHLINYFCLKYFSCGIFLRDGHSLENKIILLMIKKTPLPWGYLGFVSN